MVVGREVGVSVGLIFGSSEGVNEILGRLVRGFRDI